LTPQVVKTRARETDLRRANAALLEKTTASSALEARRRRRRRRRRSWRQTPQNKTRRNVLPLLRYLAVLRPASPPNSSSSSSSRMVMRRRTVVVMLPALSSLCGGITPPCAGSWRRYLPPPAGEGAETRLPCPPLRSAAALKPGDLAGASPGGMEGAAEAVEVGLFYRGCLLAPGEGVLLLLLGLVLRQTLLLSTPWLTAAAGAAVSPRMVVMVLSRQTAPAKPRLTTAAAAAAAVAAARSAGRHHRSHPNKR
ncbi:unnamed protein product, partial [Ectocarpus fasciculatus]